VTGLAFVGLARASEMIRGKQISPVDYTQELLARIDRIDGRLHAFLSVYPDRALAAAREAEREIMAGTWRGPLHGVPFALKDIIDVAGQKTTGHSKILIDNVAAEDAFVTARLQAAGGVLLGKLSTHEFAIGGPSFDLPWPPAVNPWGKQHFPGGSSSGSGVSVAAGMVPASIGTDTAGSIRNPASMCGVTGMKPTYGLVSRRGVFPLAYSLDHVGPITRSVADNALLLQAIAGYDPRDGSSASGAVPDYSADLHHGVEGLRIGVIRHFYAEEHNADPEQIAAIDAAAAVLRDLGAEVTDVRLPPLSEFATCARIILSSEAFAIHRGWLATRAGEYGELARARILEGAAVTAADYIDAQRLRARLMRRTNDAFADVDVCLTASSFDPACEIDDADAIARAYPRQARQPFNVTGQPAIAIPCGFTSDGLPLSLQIVGHAFQEATVYRVAQAYESATSWLDRHPPGLDDDLRPQGADRSIAQPETPRAGMPL
jgi:aspartyl-tRNA(Asn)/glutamyl-tRNA(Gln) amidotransferase subunit A